MTYSVVLAFGLVLGMQHATEADHLAAVASLASRERTLRSGIFHGVAWGAGHTLTLLVATASIGLLGRAVSPELSAGLERIVGIMLILLGLDVLRRLARQHARNNPDVSMEAPSADRPRAEPQDGRRSEAAVKNASHSIPWRSVLVGTVHGLAGSAALTLLASASMPTLGWMLAYAGVFGVGSVCGMAILSGAFAIPLSFTAHRLARVHRQLNACVGLVSIALGMRMLLAASAA